MMKKDSIASMMPLFLVIAIDSMGLGILFPILSAMIISPDSTFLSAGTSEFMREFFYGAIIGIYMIAWFFGAAILGDLSDVIGRRRSLMICLVGAAIGYGISGAAFFCHSLWLLAAGRIIAGFTAGSQPIAQAAVVDMSSEARKARNLGLVLLAVSLGFVLGPLFGGFLTDQRLASWFNYSTPMFFAALLSLCNIVMLYFLFKESHVVTKKVSIRPHYAIQIFIEAFRHPKIRALSFALLVFIAGWGEYFGFISQFLIRRYHYDALETSLFMMVMALGFSLGFAVLVDYCANRFSLKKCITLCMLIGAIFCALTLIHNSLVAWICTFFVGTAIAIAYSLLITLFSDAVNSAEQGWVMGVTNAIMALSFGVTTFFSGFAANMSASAPIIFSAAGLLIACVVMFLVKA